MQGFTPYIKKKFSTSIWIIRPVLGIRILPALIITVDKSFKVAAYKIIPSITTMALLQTYTGAVVADAPKLSNLVLHHGTAITGRRFPGV